VDHIFRRTRISERLALVPVYVTNYHETAPNGTRQDPLTINVTEAARLLGIGRNSAYTAANNGQLPTIRIGGRLLVPWAALQDMVASATSKDFVSAAGA
jgi:excisionase family DNA binding protein